MTPVQFQVRSTRTQAYGSVYDTQAEADTQAARFELLGHHVTVVPVRRVNDRWGGHWQKASA